MGEHFKAKAKTYFLPLLKPDKIVFAKRRRGDQQVYGTTGLTFRISMSSLTYSCDKINSRKRRFHSDYSLRIQPSYSGGYGSRTMRQMVIPHPQLEGKEI